MPPVGYNATIKVPSSAARPACFVAGLLLIGSARSVNAFIPSTATTFRGMLPSLPVQQRRTCVRSRGAVGVRFSAVGGSGAGDIDSSELYADMRRRLEELRRREDSLAEGEQEEKDDPADRRRNQRDPGAPPGGGGQKSTAGVKAYSGQEMKKAYYEAFWRARNLHQEAKFEEGKQDDSNSESSSSGAAPPALPPSAQMAASRSTLLTPMAMDLVLSRSACAGTTAVSASEVQGLTQMYYLEEEESVAASVSSAASVLRARRVSAAAGGGNDAGAALRSKGRVTEAEFPAAAQVLAFGAPLSEELAKLAEPAEPQGFTQMFFLEAEEEAAAATAMPLLAGRSFLREKLGVSGEVVKDLRQVELDHARLAMLAVLLSGAVSTGAGVPAGANFMDAHVGLAALAEVARTPWLDPCVAGVILAVKALSEGDWRLGKGALAGWADHALRAVSESGAKVLRLGSGDEIRRLALEMEVKHGRLALGAVVCAMAQQGLLAVELVA